MKIPLRFRPIALVLPILIITAGVISAQPESKAPQVEPSYDVSLQLIIGSNDAGGRQELPSTLNAVAKQMKTSFAFSNYRLASTFLGRLANTGNFEYKSTSNIFGQESTGQTQSFLEWSVMNFRNMPTAKGATGFQAQAFRFGARVPVLMGGGKENSISYESIGVGLSKIGLVENVPTLIGTLNLPGTSGTIFLVMTVKSADE